MKLELNVSFDVSKFKTFTIDNPVYIPTNGEIFECKWDDFIDDKEQIKLLKEFDEDEFWIVERFRSKYTKEKIVSCIYLKRMIDEE